MKSGKALFLINGEHYAGAERVQDLLGVHLPSLGWQVDFVCLRPGIFERMRDAKSSRVIALRKRSRLDLARPVREVARMMQEGDYDLLHTHTPGSALVGHYAVKRTAKPMVHHVHGRVDLEQDSVFRNRIGSALQRFSLRHAERVIAVSERTADYLRESGCDSRRIRVVLNGVASMQTPRDWQAPRSEWVIGMAALFRPIKGVEIAIDALARLRATGLPVSLRAVGAFEREEYRREVMDLVAAKGMEKHVVWTGFTRDMTKELAQMDLFVVPSLYGEGLPMVLLEAMSAGVPVVASSVEGIPSALGHGAAGVLVEPGNPMMLARALWELIENPHRAREFSRIGMQRQREHYSERSMARQVAAVYRELQEEKRAA